MSDISDRDYTSRVQHKKERIVGEHSSFPLSLTAVKSSSDSHQLCVRTEFFVTGPAVKRVFAFRIPGRVTGQFGSYQTPETS